MGTPLKLPPNETASAPKRSKGGAVHSAVHVAAVNAAAASFAGLTAKLDYLSPADFDQVRLAYRFADEARKTGRRGIRGRNMHGAAHSTAF